MKILLATDGSEHSEAAVDEIVRRPFPANSEVLVISIFEPPILTTGPYDGGVDMRVYQGFEDAAHERARLAVEMAVDKLRVCHEGRHLRISTEIVRGSPKEVILDEAEKFGADLIVVGSHGYGFFKRFLLGSVSHSVALHAKCSVEIVRTKPEKPAGEDKQ